MQNTPKREWRVGDILYTIIDVRVSDSVKIPRGTEVVVTDINADHNPGICFIQPTDGGQGSVCPMEILSSIPGEPDLPDSLSDICKMAEHDYNIVLGHERHMSSINRVITALKDPAYKCTINVSMTKENNEQDVNLYITNDDISELPEKIRQDLCEAITKALEYKKKCISLDISGISNRYQNLM